MIRASLRNRGLVLALALLAMVYGGLAFRSLPVDVFPDLNRPTVTLMTEAPGLSPEEVEVLVTNPLEAALNGAPGVERLRSQSGLGLSVVYVEFGWGSDLYVDRQIVAERLALAREKLPAEVVPVMAPTSSIMGEISLLGLRGGEETEPMALRALADWVIRPRLLSIPGVSQVIPIGGEVTQFQVIVRPERLLSFGLSLEEVARALEQANQNASGGFLSRQGQELLVRAEGRLRGTGDISAVVVAQRGGVPITVAQVAEVSAAPNPMKRGDASINAMPAVILSIQKQPGADTVALTRAVEEALQELAPALPRDVTLSPGLFRQASFIEAAIANVEEALRDGALLVVLVLVLFLMNLRTTLITLTAIPLSLAVTALVFSLFGLSVNTMTLGGLAVAIGELVDDAIVDVENVLRRLRENQRLPAPLPALRVVYRASAEVRSSIVYATALVVLVFVPLFSLPGIEGRLFVPLGLAYITSILASLLVSLTVTPALASLLLGRAERLQREEEGRLVRWLKRQDEKLLRAALRRSDVVIAGALALVVSAGALVPLLGAEFLPPFNEGTITVNVQAPPGTSLEASNQLGRAAEQLILGVPEVASTGRRTGRAELDEHAEGVHYSEIDVDLHASDRSREEVFAELRQRLSLLPGVVVSLGQPIGHRLDHLLSGVRAQIAIKLFGPDLDVLRAKAEELRRLAARVPGLVDLQVEAQVLVPQVLVRPIPEKARLYGFAPGSLSGAVGRAFSGEVVTQLLDGRRVFDVVLRYPSLTDEDALRRALLDTPSGAKIPLGSVAEVLRAEGPNQISHEGGARRIVISANTEGRDVGAVVAELRAVVARELLLPEGVSVTYGGQFESQQQATRRIAILALLSLAGMLAVLYAHFRSWAITLQILLNIPLSLVGAVAAVWMTGGVLSVATLVGFVTLTGIAARNGIMMISHYLHLMREEGEGFSCEMIIRGSLERLVPVLMTALTAILALLPLAFSAGAPGKEILQPVAVVIVGGLLSSTLLDMVVTPAVFWRFGRASAERALHPVVDELSDGVR